MVTVKRIFYLGAHHPDWLSKARVPLFISRNRLTDGRLRSPFLEDHAGR